MKTVRMVASISGARNGQPWPARGESVELPDHEADDMVAAGLAKEAAAVNRKQEPSTPPKPRTTNRKLEPGEKRTTAPRRPKKDADA